jgi:hypothetical protein
MAEILETYAFATGGKGVAKYPWDQWLDGRIHRLRRGDVVDEDHFTCAAATLQTQVHTAAHARGKLARVKVEDKDTVVLIAYRQELHGVCPTCGQEVPEVNGTPPDAGNANR